MKIYEKLNDVTNTKWNKKPEDCTNHEIYYAMLEMTNKLCRDLPKPQGERKLYYFSAEFLVGKLLSNNLLALGIFEETEKVLNEKVTAKDVMLLVEGMLAPVEGKIGEAYHSYMLHEYIIEDLAKKVFGKDVDMDKLYKDAEKKFDKQQKELKEKRKEILKKQIESLQKEMDK